MYHIMVLILRFLAFDLHSLRIFDCDEYAFGRFGGGQGLSEDRLFFSPPSFSNGAHNVRRCWYLFFQYESSENISRHAKTSLKLS